MLVIGIDPGIAITGYGLLEEAEDGSVSAVDYGVISTSHDLSVSERLIIIYRQLNHILKLHKPDSGAVERLFFYKNVKTASSVGQAKGVSMLALAQSGLHVYEYSPKEVKTSVTGYGGADKRQIQEMVKILLNLADIPRPDDAADALAVAICHLHHVQMMTALGK
jgi:crossover junction endodeoxyribonuclease RuvC